MKLTIQNRVAKIDVEPNATNWISSRSSTLHVRDVRNVKRSGESLNMESKNLSHSLKVNEFAAFDNQCTGRQAQQCVEWLEALGKNTHIEIRGADGTFFVSFNSSGAVHDTLVMCCAHMLTRMCRFVCVVDMTTHSRWRKPSVLRNQPLTLQPCLSSHGKVSLHHVRTQSSCPTRTLQCALLGILRNRTITEEIYLLSDFFEYIKNKL